MRFILKKTGVLIVTLLLISLLAYLAFQIVPGDPTTVILGLDYPPSGRKPSGRSWGWTGMFWCAIWTGW